eukprot:CAMPEP_0205935782 /NCGR_PEP_ID=MMETSP1325-20131115/39890_1 /ASSEMBLY_ACC=CAM_ASM_000708 /TAXON_ID=236786 /ORGANISM="Florenciella sp., Strain RCC1007" /LENGTH=166 /DNA_ID=CAMNT_0053305885 /DNA_START=5 /DNA_END=502 /DNA_ORIENTATION=-
MAVARRSAPPGNTSCVVRPDQRRATDPAVDVSHFQPQSRLPEIPLTTVDFQNPMHGNFKNRRSSLGNVRSTPSPPWSPPWLPSGSPLGSPEIQRIMSGRSLTASPRASPDSSKDLEAGGRSLEVKQNVAAGATRKAATGGGSDSARSGAARPKLEPVISGHELPME